MWSTIEYISTIDASKKWGISVRQVQRLLAEGRIMHAKKYGRAWMIPEGAEKPVDSRKKAKSPLQFLSFELAQLIEATSIPMPTHNPDEILEIIKEDKVRLLYEGELSYLRGDFAYAIACYDKTFGDDASRLRSSLVAVAAAISLGDYPSYLEIEAYLKTFINTGRDYECNCSAVAELALASVAVSVAAPNMAPHWLIEGDFSTYPPQAKPAYMLFLRSKYFMSIGKYEMALAVAQTALAFCSSEKGITLSEIYLHLICALACNRTSCNKDAKAWLLETMKLALPHGFVTPFAEYLSDFDGLVEQCLSEAFPEYLDTIIGQWEKTVVNWISFHNHFTKDNVTKILTLREYHMASLAVRRVPYAEIAKQFNISVGRLKNIMQEIYGKLYISGRDELAQYIMLPNQDVV